MTVDGFKIYDKKNPQVYEAFKKFTFQVIETGRKYFSARAIYEQIRWQTMIEDDEITFKMQDHPLPFYARKFENEFPLYKGFFQMRKCEADNFIESKH